MKRVYKFYEFTPIGEGYDKEYKERNAWLMPALIDLEKGKLILNWLKRPEFQTVCNFELNNEGLLIKPFKIGRRDHTSGDFYSRHPFLNDVIREWDEYIERTIIGATE